MQHEIIDEEDFDGGTTRNIHWSDEEDYPSVLTHPPPNTQTVPPLFIETKGNVNIVSPFSKKQIPDDVRREVENKRLKAWTPIPSKASLSPREQKYSPDRPVSQTASLAETGEIEAPGDEIQAVPLSENDVTENEPEKHPESPPVTSSRQDGESDHVEKQKEDIVDELLKELDDQLVDIHLENSQTSKDSSSALQLPRIQITPAPSPGPDEEIKALNLENQMKSRVTACENRSQSCTSVADSISSTILDVLPYVENTEADVSLSQYSEKGRHFDKMGDETTYSDTFSSASNSAVSTPRSSPHHFLTEAENMPEKFKDNKTTVAFKDEKQIETSPLTKPPASPTKASRSDTVIRRETTSRMLTSSYGTRNDDAVRVYNPSKEKKEHDDMENRERRYLEQEWKKAEIEWKRNVREAAMKGAYSQPPKGKKQ